VIPDYSIIIKPCKEENTLCPKAEGQTADKGTEHEKSEKSTSKDKNLGNISPSF